MDLQQVIDCFHNCFTEKYNVILKGGFDEPFYQAATQTQPAEIQFREDFLRSALHEVSHWCVAGKDRRLKDDFGYWYEPDGRNFSQQLDFFQVEILPQAFEWIFCDTLSVEFEVSVDNLDLDLQDLETHIRTFKQKVLEKKEQVLNSNGHQRVHFFANRLALNN